MEHPILFINVILQYLGLPVPHTVTGHTLLEKLCAPYMTYTWLVMAFWIIVPRLTMGKLEIIPGKGQNFWEVLIGGLMDFFEENLGRDGARMLYPMMATFFLYIVVANMIGLIPGFMSPTSNLNITLGMTLIVWVTHHILGFRYHGIKYYKHFMGPLPVMAPFMFILEVISNFARLLSLSMRLFGNILAKEILLAVLFMLAGAYFAPLPILCLGVLVSLIQAVVFTLLSVLYCAQAMEHAH
ncbi:ATP synthase subunit a [Desulfolithobacter dissulfuricans]|uniref:ATP synthase subunit a n=1 Tax=Desulfolithobacter dissulfuricans TaxID=2795293 RepID=A0A915UB16_9BACT|nr:F0F1 ATP synthase subunit A [Desulfolithobacter dissulfuricans]BCO10190.1 ATP synthase subunit a [Desulfolithobacter dissulfuricans]